MPNSIEDILVCIHDDPELDEHTKLGRMVREVSAHLVPFGHYTATERVRIGAPFGQEPLPTPGNVCTGLPALPVALPPDQRRTFPAGSRPIPVTD